MDPGGDILARVLYAIFKGRPNVAYWVFATIILAFIVGKLLTAKNRDEMVLPIMSLAFVSIVLIGRVVRLIRKQSVQDFQSIEETPAVMEAPIVPEMPPAQEPRLRVAEGRLAEAPLPHKPIKIFSRMLARDFLGALIISIVCFSLGYFFAYLLGTDTLIALGPSNIYVQLWEISTELLGGLAIQAICGMPCAFSISSNSTTL
jgi:hypothetical protein